MRTISDIKKELTDAFMADAQLQAAYGFAPGTAFDKQFSRISLESLLLYIVAFAQWTLEKLFDTHTQEVTDYIATMKPHTLRWYRRKRKRSSMASTSSMVLTNSTLQARAMTR
jgi:hypothetical protein